MRHSTFYTSIPQRLLDLTRAAIPVLEASGVSHLNASAALLTAMDAGKTTVCRGALDLLALSEDKPGRLEHIVAALANAWFDAGLFRPGSVYSSDYAKYVREVEDLLAERADTPAAAAPCPAASA